jgi:hypothetical protein
MAVALDVGCSTFSACHAEAFGVGGFDVLFSSRKGG